MRAPLWLHAGHWKAAAEAVATIESWRRIPAPPAPGVGGPVDLVGGGGALGVVGGMVEGGLQLVGVPGIWAMLAELACLSPRRLNDLVRRSPDPLFAQWSRRFETSFEGAGDA